MASKKAKVDYVKKHLTPTGDHKCHWPGCTKQVAPALWGCFYHWMRIPKRLRDAIWAAYKPGQEITKTPSREYMRAAQDIQDWIKENA